MSCIFQVCWVHSFEAELCFLIQFWLQHYIVLNHDIGMQHWITHKHMKWEFRYPLYIRGICHTYTAAVHIHGIYMVYTGIYRLYTSSGFQMHVYDYWVLYIPCTYMYIHFMICTYMFKHGTYYSIVYSTYVHGINMYVHVYTRWVGFQMMVYT